MKWYEINITTTSEASDSVSEMLQSVGSAGVAIEDPNDLLQEIKRKDTLDYADPEFLENLGEDVIIKAYFSESFSLNETLVIIREKLNYISSFLSIGKGEISSKTIDEEDWANSWKKYYETFKITDNITVKPSWEESKEFESKITIELDPGMAFGTGTHETTKMCAMLLEKYLREGQEVFDVGTGSGILSIISKKLGAKEVLAYDIDEVAVRVAIENANINNVDITIKKGIIEDYKGNKFNIIVANIIASVIISISNEVRKNLVSGGFFIASGIIKERKQEVLEQYLQNGFEEVEIIEMGEWVAIVFKCPDSL